MGKNGNDVLMITAEWPRIASDLDAKQRRDALDIAGASNDVRQRRAASSGESHAICGTWIRAGRQCQLTPGEDGTDGGDCIAWVWGRDPAKDRRGKLNHNQRSTIHAIYLQSQRSRLYNEHLFGLLIHSLVF